MQDNCPVRGDRRSVHESFLHLHAGQAGGRSSRQGERLLDASAIHGPGSGSEASAEESPVEPPAPLHQNAECRRFMRRITSLGRHHQWQQAVEVFNHMPQPDILSYSSLIRALTKSQQWQQALVQLDAVHTKGLKPNTTVLNSAMGVSTICGWEAGLRLLDDMIEHQVKPDGLTYKKLIQSCQVRQPGEWQQALVFLRSMTGAGINATSSIYKTVISMHEPDGQWRWALALLNDMTEHRVQPEGDALTSVCKGCAHGHRWKEALHMLEQASPTIGHTKQAESLYTDVMRTCIKCDEWEWALALSGDLQRRCRRSTNLQSFELALSSCEMGNLWHEAVRLMAKLKKTPLAPSLKCYNAAIGACELEGKWEEAISWLSELSLQGQQPNTASYNAAMVACLVSASWQRPLVLLEELRSRGLSPDGGTYCAAIDACAQGGKWHEALDLLAEVRTTGLDLDISAPTLNGAIEACLANQRWDLAWKLVNTAQP